MFFVLSGYLISNILFREYKRDKKIRVKRFLIRRAFKIIPPFYFFMIASISVDFLSGKVDYGFPQLAAELFYVQSYFPRIWLHTWTLAVEEQFYLLFSISLFYLIRGRILEKRNVIIGGLILLLMLSFVMRFYVSWPHRMDAEFPLSNTHLRSDGILLGILVSYLLNFTKITSELLKRKDLLIGIAILCIVPGFYFEGAGFFMNTFGLTLVNLGFAIVVLLSLNIDEYVALQSPPYFASFLRIIAFIGVNSYSIYLWHLNVRGLANAFLFSFDPLLKNTIYILLAIFIGTTMSYLIEKPSLRIRDYLLNRWALFDYK